jgi:hypothetical protein
MKIGKFVALAGMAAVLVMAVVGPASASAAVWKKEGATLKSFVELGLTGGEIFETGGANGMSCKVTAKMTTEGGSTAQITSFKTVECPTGFGTMKGCTMTLSEAKGLPWAVTVNASTLTISGMHVRRTFKSGCAVTETNSTIPSSTVTLNTPTAITEMSFSGEISGFKEFGSWTIEGTNSGKYGIG